MVSSMGRASNVRRIHHISMALVGRNTPNPPDAHAMVHRSNSATFSARMALLNESLNLPPILVSSSFSDAILAALVAAAANSGKASSPAVVHVPSFS